MTMEDCTQRIDIILEAGGDAILNDAEDYCGICQSFAESQFLKYRIIQDRLFQSDFYRRTIVILPNTIEYLVAELVELLENVLTKHFQPYMPQKIPVVCLMLKK